MNLVSEIRDARLEAYKKVPRDILSHFNDEEAERKNYAGRPLFELLQNVEDAMSADGTSRSRKILVRQVADVLYIANEGIPFSKVGLEALCDRSISPKRGLDFIGSKGIGFKSALNWTDAPRILSGDIRAEFSRQRALDMITSHLDPAALAELRREHRWSEAQVPLLRLPFDHRPDNVESALLAEGWPTIVSLPYLITASPMLRRP